MSSLKQRELLGGLVVARDRLLENLAICPLRFLFYPDFSSYLLNVPLCCRFTPLVSISSIVRSLRSYSSLRMEKSGVTYVLGNFANRFGRFVSYTHRCGHKPRLFCASVGGMRFRAVCTTRHRVAVRCDAVRCAVRCDATEPRANLSDLLGKASVLPAASTRHEKYDASRPERLGTASSCIRFDHLTG